MQSSDGQRHYLPPLLVKCNDSVRCFQTIEEGGRNKELRAAIIHRAALLPHVHVKLREASSGGTARMSSVSLAMDTWRRSLQLTVLSYSGSFSTVPSRQPDPSDVTPATIRSGIAFMELRGWCNSLQCLSQYTINLLDAGRLIRIERSEVKFERHLQLRRRQK